MRAAIPPDLVCSMSGVLSPRRPVACDTDGMAHARATREHARAFAVLPPPEHVLSSTSSGAHDASSRASHLVLRLPRGSWADPKGLKFRVRRAFYFEVGASCYGVSEDVADEP